MHVRRESATVAASLVNRLDRLAGSLIIWLVALEIHSGWAFCQIWLEVY